MEIVKEVTLKERAGGFGAPDTSDNLDDMNYAERLVLEGELDVGGGKTIRFLDALKELKTVEKVEEKGKPTTYKGGALMLTKEDILPFRDDKDIEMNGVAHKVNQVFVALDIPYYATSFSTGEAEKVEKTKSRGKNVGKTYSVTIPDRLRVYKISDKFSIDNYAAEGSKRVKEEGVNAYNEPTEGMRLREAKWIEERGEEVLDTLRTIGVDV